MKSFWNFYLHYYSLFIIIIIIIIYESCDSVSVCILKLKLI